MYTAFNTGPTGGGISSIQSKNSVINFPKIRDALNLTVCTCFCVTVSIGFSLITAGFPTSSAFPKICDTLEC